MYNHQPENYVCPLCQIAKSKKTVHGNQEETVIFRDEFLTAFISGKWWRSNPGHIIIIPNEHYENLYDLPEELGRRIFDLSKKASIALKEVYNCSGISTRQHNEPEGGQDVWHYHLHVFPRYEKDNLYLNDKDTYWPSIDEKKPFADMLIRYFMQFKS